jgi:hypothetical protein
MKKTKIKHDISLVFSSNYKIKELCFCFEYIVNAFLPNSNTNPPVNSKKNINIINNPYALLLYALTVYGYINNISKSNNKNNNAKIKKEIVN